MLKLRPKQAKISLHITVIVAIFSPQLTHAQTPPAQSGADLLNAVTRCRSLSEDAERLRCFDAATLSLSQAGDVTIVSRAEVQQNQRRLFGFNASILNPFDGDGRSEDIQSISATTTNIRDLGRGEWIITLDDGSAWRKIDASTPTFSLRRQYPVTVRRAALGSYMMKVADNPPFRVRRE